MSSSNQPGCNQVFGGSAGRALLFLQRFEAWGQASDLATALEYIEGALASVGAVSASTCGFLWGRPGVGAVGAVVRSRAGDEAGAQSLVDALVGYFEKAPDDSECPYDDWDSGRAGLLYVSKFLDEMLPQWPGGLPVIDRDLLAPVALAIIDRGTRLSDSPGEYLEWLSPNDQGKWLGMSHGSAGVLHGLLLVPEVVLGNSTARRLILGTIDHIVAQQQPSGNFPSEVLASSPPHSAWLCYSSVLWTLFLTHTPARTYALLFLLKSRRTLALPSLFHILLFFLSRGAPAASLLSPHH